MERRPVKIRSFNDADAVIESGMQEGALVARHPRQALE
jgi:hypothetical protein